MASHTVPPPPDFFHAPSNHVAPPFSAMMASDAAFRATIARAREAQQHAIIDETIEMADAATPEDWQVVKLRIWARQWRAAKLAPRTYGNKVEVAGSDENPLTLLIQEVQGRAIKPVQIVDGEMEET